MAVWLLMCFLHVFKSPSPMLFVEMHTKMLFLHFLLVWSLFTHFSPELIFIHIFYRAYNFYQFFNCSFYQNLYLFISFFLIKTKEVYQVEGSLSLTFIANFTLKSVGFQSCHLLIAFVGKYLVLNIWYYYGRWWGFRGIMQILNMGSINI